MNREGWLTEVAKRAEELFKGYRLAPYRVTCGWPSKAAISRNRRLGECHYRQGEEAGGFREIFISPTLDDSLEVAGTMLHEMAHVIAGYQAAHGPRFVKVCKNVGLTKGRPTSVMPGPALNGLLKRIITDIGPYPHKALKVAAKEPKPSAVATLVCEACGCKVTMSLKWLADSGEPTCGCGGAMKRG